MKEKIDWYQEVLELEPGSKVFFPLGKLLVESGRFDDAVDTLERGLDRHPEFFEARLYLIDILFKAGQSEALQKHIEQLIPMLIRYTGFWQAWSGISKAQGGDAGIALAFLAESFKRGGLNLGEVLQRGLLSMQTEDAKAAPVAESFSPADTINEPAAVTPATEMSVPVVEDVPVVSDATVEAAVETFQVTPAVEDAAAVAVEEVDDVAEGSEEEERFTLRTQSMADVLAEQGDYTGALEIYQELLGVAGSLEEMAQLQQRITTLTEQMNEVNVQPATAAPVPSVTESAGGKQRVISVLEALAERLDSRVH